MTRPGKLLVAILVTILVTMTGGAGAAQAAGPRPDLRAPWTCGESRSYFHHSQEVSNALDIVGAPGGDLGAPVLASAAGTVTSARTNGGYGQEVVVSHGNGWSTRVAHLNTIEVAVGQSVGTGQRLGTVGSTGNSTGPHLHYEQIADGVRMPIVIDGVALAYSTTPRSHVSDNCMVSRFAFVNGGGSVYVKDGSHADWGSAINAGGASKVVLSGNWIGVLQGGQFLAKSGIFGQWKPMTGGGMVDVAVFGDRFAAVNSQGQVFVKDGADSDWGSAINAGGASKVVLSGNWIGVLQGGQFLAKYGIFGQWKPMTGGGVTDISLGGNDWFGAVTGGNFYAKQGVDTVDWLPMAGGGDVRSIALHT